MERQQSRGERGGPYSAHAVVFERPESLSLREVRLTPPAQGEVVVDVEWTGISTGTEKLLWSGRMPQFPGLGYPLVPGYETVGTIAECSPDAGGKVGVQPGARVFVPGARCFGELRGLFGGAASRLVVDQGKVVPVGADLGEEAVLLALAATAHHALHYQGSAALPDLIVGHGVLGRLLARLTIALGGPAPMVWEIDARRGDGAAGYSVLHPDVDERRDYRRILDASGAPALLDGLIQRLAKGGEIVLAGFYQDPLSFTFPPAFMREASIRVAAEWSPGDLVGVMQAVGSGALSLDDLVSHRSEPGGAEAAYAQAFADPDCLKMVLDWRNF